MAEPKDEWITQSEAADLLGMQLAAVNQLVRRKVIDSDIRYGKRLVSRTSVLAYIPRANRKTARKQLKAPKLTKAGKKRGGKK